MWIHEPLSAAAAVVEVSSSLLEATWFLRLTPAFFISRRSVRTLLGLKWATSQRVVDILKQPGLQPLLKRRDLRAKLQRVTGLRGGGP